MTDAAPWDTRQPVQPLTFRGAARFASGSLVRLYLWGLLLSVATGVTVSLLAARAWAPVVEEALGRLPNEASIQNGFLFWPDKQPRTLGANSYLSLSVQPGLDASESTPSDVTLIFRERSVRFNSLLGYTVTAYPANWQINLNRSLTSSLWGAWEPALVVFIGIAAALGVMISWMLLAIPYALLPWFLAGLLKRDLAYSQAWKLSVAAQFPGALLMVFGLVLYATGESSLLFLLIIFVAHFVVTWIYLLLAPFCLPAVESAAAENPFTERKSKLLK